MSDLRHDNSKFQDFSVLQLNNFTPGRLGHRRPLQEILKNKTTPNNSLRKTRNYPEVIVRFELI